MFYSKQTAKWKLHVTLLDQAVGENDLGNLKDEGEACKYGRRSVDGPFRPCDGFRNEG
jgi:hypothetical protein